MNPQRLIRPVGILLMMASFGYLIERLWSNQVWTMGWRPDSRLLVAAVLGTLIYGAASLLLSAAWTHLLKWCGENKVSFTVGHAVYGRTQIAKYLPGNVFQYAGRQVLGRQAGFQQLPMAAASIYEILAFLLGAGIVASLGMSIFGIDSGGLTPAHLALILAIASAVLLGLSAASPYIARTTGVEVKFNSMRDIFRMIVPAFLMYATFILIVGSVLAYLVHSDFGLTSLRDLSTIIVGFSVAWIAGFITPGAPGGLGVREAVMTLFLAPLIGDNQAVVIALIFRVMTVSGDVLFFFSAVWLGRLPSVAQSK